jgi:hypothetical protein
LAATGQNRTPIYSLEKIASPGVETGAVAG